MLEEEGNISPEDMNIFTITDDPDEVVRIVRESEEKYWIEPGGLVRLKRPVDKLGRG